MNVIDRVSKSDKYRLAFEVTPVPMILVNGGGEIVLTNKLLDDLFGYDDGELIGESVEVLVPSNARDHHPELRSAYFRVPTKRGMGVGRDLFGVTKSGDVVPLELGLEPVSEGDETWAIVAAIDIRQRKAHEARMHVAMDAAASAMIMVDSDGVIVFSNRAASMLFGYAAEELLGQPVEQLVPDTMRRVHPVYRQSFMQATAARSMGLGRDLFARHKDGSEIPVEIALTPVETPQGKMVMSTINDLTERVAAQNAMAQKQEELEALNLELTRFAFGASHDLKAPLASVIGLLTFCEEDLADGNLDELKSNLTKAIETCRRSSDKVEGVLAIARVGHEDLATEPIDLDILVNEIWQDLTSAATDPLKLTTDLSHGDPFVGEAATLKIILENLIGNAIRYRDVNKPDLTVTVKSNVVDQMIVISVADNGCGIPNGRHQDVFEMFKRIDDRSGSGLGLSLVKKQIERLRGTIEFASQEGVGTTFTFRLPHRKREDYEYTSDRR